MLESAYKYRELGIVARQCRPSIMSTTLNHTVSVPRPHDLEDKHEMDHAEDAKIANRVEDVAADYVDPTVHISPEENKRLRRKIYKQCVSAASYLLTYLQPTSHHVLGVHYSIFRQRYYWCGFHHGLATGSWHGWPGLRAHRHIPVGGSYRWRADCLCCLFVYWEKPC